MVIKTTTMKTILKYTRSQTRTRKTQTRMLQLRENKSQKLQRTFNIPTQSALKPVFARGLPSHRYIRDLITMLEDTENFDQHHLALITGPSLIRRKADFGSELKDRIVELASIYTGLNDHFNLPDFHDLRLQGTMAILISQPQIMGPWLAEAFFSGDYSVGQRAGMLTAIGLSGRELAGLDKDGEHDKKQQFPSKTLPDRLHSMYAEESDMNALAKRLQKSMITRVSTKKRTKLIKNDLARIVTESFFFPLTGRFQSQAKIK